MPTYTKNQIWAMGAREDLAALIEAVRSADEVFDFERLIPMPAILNHVIEISDANGRRLLYRENPRGKRRRTRSAAR